MSESELSAAGVAAARPWPFAQRGLLSRLYPLLTELWQLLDAAAVGVALYVLTRVQDAEFIDQHAALLAVTTVIMLAVYSWSDLFYRLRTRSLLQESARLLHAWAIVLVLLMAIGYVLQAQHEFPPDFVLAWGAAAYGAQMLVHFCVRKSLHFMRRRGYNIRRALVVGCGAPLERYVGIINRNPWLGIRIEGYVAEPEWLNGKGNGSHKEPRARTPALHVVSGIPERGAAGELPGETDANQPGTAGGKLRLLGGLADVERLIDGFAINEIYVALPLERSADAEVAVRALVNVPVNINWLPDFSVAQVLSTRADELDGHPLVLLSDSRIERHGQLVKRIEDVIISSMLIALLSPLLLAIAWAVKRSSPGPILFKQQRHGLGGRRILVWKFRTMRVSSHTEIAKQAIRNDDRVTSVGRWLRRWSLDELPQLFNVWDGSMSLIGPRPHPLWLNDRFSQVIDAYMQRHRVLPGITGWAQVNGCRGETGTPEKMEQRLKYDLYYITHWSPWLDLKILARTVTAVFRGDSAY